MFSALIGPIEVVLSLLLCRPRLFKQCVLKHVKVQNILEYFMTNPTQETVLYIKYFSRNTQVMPICLILR